MHINPGTIMYDSTVPTNIPHREFAMLYHDGKFGPEGIAAAHLFDHIHWITIWGDPNAGIADYEPGNPVYFVPGALRKWVQARNAMGKPARVYCDRVDVAKAAAECEGHHHSWIIATLDGKQWTQETLAQDIRDNWNAVITPASIWANQNYHQPQDLYDSSNIFGSIW